MSNKNINKNNQNFHNYISTKNNKSIINREIEFEICMDYACNIPIYTILDKYRISRSKLNSLIRKPFNQKIIKERQKSILNTTYRTFAKLDKKYEEYVNKLFNKALDDKVIEKTSLGTLAHTLEVLSERYDILNKFLLEKKKLELEKLKVELELEKQNKLITDNEGNIIEEKSIIETFIDEIDKQATQGLDKKEKIETIFLSNKEINSPE